MLDLLDKGVEILLDAVGPEVLEPGYARRAVRMERSGRRGWAGYRARGTVSHLVQAAPGAISPVVMNTSVLDILIYVFDRYMLDEAPELLERGDLKRDLERAGFASGSVERALDWLADLAGEGSRPGLADSSRSVRVFSDCELTRLSTECRGFLMTLERLEVLSPAQREIVIERMLALDADELDTEQLKWVVLMVLSSQPGQDRAFARMQDVAFDAATHPPH